MFLKSPCAGINSTSLTAPWPSPGAQRAVSVIIFLPPLAARAQVCFPRWWLCSEPSLIFPFQVSPAVDSMCILAGRCWVDPSFSHQIKDSIQAAEWRHVLRAAGEEGRRGKEKQHPCFREEKSENSRYCSAWRGGTGVLGLLTTAPHLCLLDVSQRSMFPRCKSTQPWCRLYADVLGNECFYVYCTFFSLFAFVFLAQSTR